MAFETGQVSRGVKAMRKIFYLLGALTLIILVTAGIGVAVFFYEGRALDAESKAFVDGAVPAIAATWDKQQLLDRATPELRRSVRPEALDALFNTLSRLGPFIEYQGATGEAAMSYMFGGGGTVSASYVAKARFQNGSAIFRRNGVRVDLSLSLRELQGSRAPEKSTLTEFLWPRRARSRSSRYRDP